MKTCWALAPFLSAAFLAGCASSGTGLVLDPVGPAPAMSSTAAPTTGTLMVFSAFDPNAPAPMDPDYRQRYMDYRILSAEGRFIQNVSNDSGSTVAAPAEVKLAPGSYRIVARANGYGVVTVPVIIAADRMTTVHLEGGSPTDATEASSAVVRLPSGQVVGWRAQGPTGL